MKPDIEAFFDSQTFTVSYVVSDSRTNRCAIIDPVLDYDPKSGRTGTQSADAIIAYVRSRDLSVEWILETHVHADHLSAAAYLKSELGGRTAIGDRVTTVQAIFSRLFNTGEEFFCDGSQFDLLLAEGDEIDVGRLTLRAMHTPGHTAACMTYLVDHCAFVGDTLFMPDYGTARTDFPGGDAATLYRSIQRILALPADTRLFMCHDYKAPGRDEYLWETTVVEQRGANVHLRDGITEADFVKFRTARDATLEMPQLLLPSVQVNMRGGELPPAEDNGIRYLKIPVDAI